VVAVPNTFDNDYRLQLVHASTHGGPVEFSGLIVRAAQTVATGLGGAIAYDGIKRVARSDLLRSAAVTVTTWGLRGARAAETGAEQARLTVGDIISEARARLGETAPVPGANGHGHEH
jgi:hypothetical protein